MPILIFSPVYLFMRHPLTRLRNMGKFQKDMEDFDLYNLKVSKITYVRKRNMFQIEKVNIPIG